MNVIGATTVYRGTSNPELDGEMVRICAVLRRARVPGLDGEQPCFIPTDGMLEMLGGVNARDRLEIVRVYPSGRQGVIYYECEPGDLELFVMLRSEVDALVAGLSDAGATA